MSIYDQAIKVSKEKPDVRGRSLSRDEALEEIRYKANIPAFWVPGFEGMKVAATIAKKPERRGNRENRNQDNIIVDPKTGLVGVTDGLGEKEGKTEGADASAILADDFPMSYEDALTATSVLDDKELVEQMTALQKQKYGHDFPGLTEELEKRIQGIMKVDPEMARKSFSLMNAAININAKVRETGGKATLCTGLVHTAPDGSKWHISINVGDSRAFKYKQATGEFVQSTIEDSLLNVLLTRGMITPSQLEDLKQNPTATFKIGKKEVTYSELKRSMVACLGGDDQLAIPSLTIRRVKKGDKILLATDGLEKKFRAGDGEEMDLQAMSEAFPQSQSSGVKINFPLTESLDMLSQHDKPGAETDDIALVAAEIE
ncbi:hypothetical protein EXS71_00390 [Candidatus Uhrbacteria bacterium]|nr:hypothetical protein [Candidatus Uhrbacteria bacterium]